MVTLLDKAQIVRIVLRNESKCVEQDLSGAVSGQVQRKPTAWAKNLHPAYAALCISAQGQEEIYQRKVVTCVEITGISFKSLYEPEYILKS